MWIYPDKIKTRDIPFSWGNLLCRVLFARDAKTGKWHKACGERSGGLSILVDDKPFPHSQAFLGEVRRIEHKYGFKLTTVDICHKPQYERVM